ncbi:YCII-related domain-containing protein [Myriangium duriaei CBS 260.36]|uniref:YCII-related domain-containing protein n=1 Tax=Myriangium duriaei CBS 260.36 TaxID=1168546 RepID=A0A9P4J0N3_9PEZI|nr:YCII-related domain-containing protein [Myriangium duriaei CBS 260.36]
MAQQYDWLVQTPANAADQQTRIDVRPAHLEHNKPLIEGGKLLFGGPALAHQPKTPDDLAVVGSIMLIRAESEQEVREMIRQDPYAKAGFWDAEGASVTPFRCVVRKGL